MYEQAINESKTHQAKLIDRDGNPSPFMPSTVFSGTISQGAGYLPLFAPIVIPSTDGSDAMVDIRIDSNAIPDTVYPGIYTLQVKDNTNKQVILDYIEFRPELKSSQWYTPKRVYCDFRDLLDHVPTLKQLQVLGYDASGFQRQREQAFNWINSCIIAKSSKKTSNGHIYCGCKYVSLPSHLNVYTYSQDKLQSFLNEGKLVTDQENDNGIAKNIASKYSLSMILKSKVISADKSDLDWRELGREFEKEAISLCNSWIPKVRDNEDNIFEVMYVN